MYINGVAHVALNVSDIKRAEEFYCGILGFQKLFDLKFDDGKTGRDWITYLKITDRQFLELFAGAEGELPDSGKTVGYSHLSLDVTDVKAITEYVRSKGVGIDSEPVLGLDGNYQSWIHDPDGNRIEFMQYGAAAFQMSEYAEPGLYLIASDHTVKREK